MTFLGISTGKSINKSILCVYGNDKEVRQTNMITRRRVFALVAFDTILKSCSDHTRLYLVVGTLPVRRPTQKKQSINIMNNRCKC